MELKKQSRLTLPMGVLDVDLAPDESAIYAATMDGVYRVPLVSDDDAEQDSPSEPERIGQHASWVSGVAVMAEGKRWVSAGYDGCLQFQSGPSAESPKVVSAHSFWSWKLAASRQTDLVASVSGQYFAGDEDYKPRESDEATVKVFEATTGELLHAWHLLPPVQAVAFSADGKSVAAANLMGDIAVWDVENGQQTAKWRTDAFTSWGIIKSHCYIGGIHSLLFAADGATLYAAGMGPMRDPMAGNGRQLWQQFRLSGPTPTKVAETKKDQAGEGLMETLALHPSADMFVMAGRLRGGDWNAGLFSCDDGNLISQLKTETRVTSAIFSSDGKRLYLAGMKGQPGPDGKGNWPAFGTIDCYQLS